MLTGLIALLLIFLQLFVCLGCKSEGCGSCPAGRRVGQPCQFGWSLGFLINILIDFSGSLEAAGSSCKCERNEDMNKVGLFLYF